MADWHISYSMPFLVYLLHKWQEANRAGRHRLAHIKHCLVPALIIVGAWQDPCVIWHQLAHDAVAALDYREDVVEALMGKIRKGFI